MPGTPEMKARRSPDRWAFALFPPRLWMASATIPGTITLGDIVRRRTAWIIVAAIVAVITVTTVVVWTNGRSYDDTVAACKKAVDGTSTKTNRPAACDGVSDDDYGAMLVGWALTHPTAN